MVTCSDQLEAEEGRVSCNDVKNKGYQLVVIINEDVADTSFLTLYSDNIEDDDKQEKVSNT